MMPMGGLVKVKPEEWREVSAQRRMREAEESGEALRLAVCN